MVTSKSAWLWAEIVKASSEAATEREFLELLIDHVRYTILQLKSVIDQSCKEVYQLDAQIKDESVIVLDHTMCEALGIQPKPHQTGTHVRISNEAFLTSIICKHMEVKTESTGSEISPEDEKPRIKEEENLSQEEPDFYDYPPLEPFDHLDQDMVEEEDDSKDLDFKFEKPKAKKTAKKPRKTAVRKPRDPNAPPKPKKSQKGVYKKPEVPKYDPEFFLCDEALWDKMVANVEPWVCPRCKAGPFCSLRQLKIHWMNKSCAGDKLHTGKNGYVKYVGIRKKTDKDNPDYNAAVFYCKHPACLPPGSDLDLVPIWKYNNNVLSHWQENHFGEMDHPPLVCPVEGCGKQFIAQPLLTLHTANKHKKSDEWYSCQHCGWMTQDKRTLSRHELRHTAAKHIKCDLCDYTTNVDSNLMEHRRRRHAEQIGGSVVSDKKFYCHVCGKPFNKQSALKVHHTKAHQSTEPDPKFKCDICGKFLKQQNSYSKHLMNVHKIGHSCDLCQKIFYSSKMLQIHKRDQHGIDAINLGPGPTGNDIYKMREGSAFAAKSVT